MKKKVFALLIALVLVVALVGCGGNDDANTEDEGEGTEALTAADFKVGFVYIGDATDQGFSNSHEDARLELEEKTGVETMFLENVPDTTTDSEKAFRDLIDQGCNVLVGCSFGYGDAMAKIAAEYPDLYFFHATGYQSGDNFVNYMGRIYKMRYEAGIAAGLKTESNKIGYVAAFDIPEVVRGINAFALGVRSVNPDATVEVKWTGSWGDPALETTAATELINGGCDVLTYHQDTVAVQSTAEKNNVFVVGYHYPTPDVAPNSYLTAAVWNWSPYYVDQIEKLIAGTWTAENYWGEDVVALDTLSSLCAEGTQEAIDEAHAKMAGGDWDVFYGPINDQDGNVKVAEGSSMTDEEMLSFNWFVEGVIGTIDTSDDAAEE